MKTILLLIILSVTRMTFAQEDSIGIFYNNKDIGNPKLTGSASYDTASQTYTIKGAGSNIWGNRDEHHFVYNKVKGDFIATANFEFNGVNEIHRKIGWMVRASEDANSAMVGGFTHGDGLFAAQWRATKGEEMKAPQNEVRAAKYNFQIIQLERRGDIFIVRAAHPGEPLEEISSKQLPEMPEEVLLGLVIGSHDVNTVETAMVWNVRIDKPVDASIDPYKNWVGGSRLETMDVFNGKRKIIRDKKVRFEAPNWMPGGDRLLFNMNGSLFTIPITGGKIEKLNTGSADNLNNDHCISFDGKMLGISYDSGQGSNVYVLPLTGGEPKAVTHNSPSYLHGWAPNNKEVVYVAQRNGREIYDIYKNSISGGQEIKLTDNKKQEHVDGCEYSPDGKYIYYNGSKNGGTMQLWRMSPDGSSKEQLTYDEYNDWFPHISPDGKWIVFISFEPTIELNSHPFFKRAILRLMPASGGAPKVIAYLYGGQGTINVNSWSPDSRHIAFVTNTGRE